MELLWIALWIVGVYFVVGVLVGVVCSFLNQAPSGIGMVGACMFFWPWVVLGIYRDNFS